MADYDESYKLLFSHPEMVRDLLLGFVHEEWVKELDFTTLERVSGSYVSDDLRERENDVVWRLKRSGDWMYIYLLIEFQSKPDPWMALRILVYMGLLYQDLVKKRGLTKTGKLPPVFPLVLYNGEKPWNSPLEVSELIEALPGGLMLYRPSLRYMLIDEGRYAESELSSSGNLAVALVQLENSRAVPELRAVLKTLNQWLYAPEQASLRRAFSVWVNRTLLPAKLPGIALPDATDLNEVNTMLAERVVEWTEQGKAEGRGEGRVEGREEGREEWLVEVREGGLVEGEAIFLARQLEIKYGPLNQAIKTKLSAADAEQLLLWGERVLTAASLEEIFAEK